MVMFLPLKPSYSDTSTQCKGDGFINVYYELTHFDIQSVYGHIDSVEERELQTDKAIFFKLNGERKRTEIFYDDMDLVFLKNNVELVFIENKGLPYYRKGRESIKFIDRSVQHEDVHFEVKKYNKKTSPLDKHVFFSKVRRKDRPLLLNKIEAISDLPIQDIQQAIKVEHHEKVSLYRLYGNSFAEVTLDNFSITNFGLPNNKTLLKIEIYDDTRNLLTESEKQQLEDKFCHINVALNTKFTSLIPLSYYGYSDYIQSADTQFPGRLFFKRYPEVFHIGQALLLSSIGFLFIYLLFKNYSQRTDARVFITRSEKSRNENK
mgnify:CR=1 FL=1